MQLRSNDYGDCPNCASTQAAENGNGISSSISYVDERGGEHTYLLDADGPGSRTLAELISWQAFSKRFMEAPDAGSAIDNTQRILRDSNDVEVFTFEEFSARFAWGDVNPVGPIFDLKKLDWLNGVHLRRLDTDDFAARLLPFLHAEGVLGPDPSLGELARR